MQVPNFEDLARLRTALASIRQNNLPTMCFYASSDGQGFWHQSSKRDKASLSSTATCVSSLVRSGLWDRAGRTWGDAAAVAKRLLRKPWESAGLAENNPFGLSFIAEGVLDLSELEPYEGSSDDRKAVVEQIIPLLETEILSVNEPLAEAGSVSIKPYPPSAYLTQLAFRVIRRAKPRESITLLSKAVSDWAFGEVHRQITLITIKSRIADPLQLAYAIVLSSEVHRDGNTSPEQKSLIREALRIFFEAQQDDGLWRPSQPIFHYPDVGNALCYEYELLTQLLGCDALRDELLIYLPNLERVTARLSHTAFDLGKQSTGQAVGWASGHHPQIAGPESWSTACVYDFVHALDRLVAEAVRKALFDELQNVYSPPLRLTRDVLPSPDDFAPGFLDAELKVEGTPTSLKNTLRDYFVVPISLESSNVANGGSLGRNTPMSAIMFGPPGTSKTQLAKLISKFLGWPLLSVDPSYLVQDGLDHLYSRANRLFTMLAATEQVVVLLDEFDEMGRDRSQSTDVLSRFITTSMLPKLAAINDQRKIVFLLATNYVSQFDAAFSRGGRFDMIIQVMPPTYEAKADWSDWKATLHAAIGKVPQRKKQDAKDALGDLTFLETQQLVFRLAGDVEDVLEEIERARNRGTLKRPNGEKTWKETCSEEEAHIRLPSIRAASKKVEARPSA